MIEWQIIESLPKLKSLEIASKTGIQTMNLNKCQTLNTLTLWNCDLTWAELQERLPSHVINICSILGLNNTLMAPHIISAFS
jgi:hypothetical protein